MESKMCHMWNHKKGKRYTLFLKSFSEIKKISSRPRLKTNKIKIHHSSGNGGGLRLKKYFIEKYCGTSAPLNLEFIRAVGGRYLYETRMPSLPLPHIILYGEWLEQGPSAFLEEDLFEI